MRVKGSIILAVLVAIGAAAWIGSGQLGDRPAPDLAASLVQSPPAEEEEAFSVRVRRTVAEPYVRTISITGQTEGSRHIRIASQIDGRVLKVGPDDGTPVKRRETLVEMDPEDRFARLQESRARLSQREVEFKAASSLAQKGFQAETRRAASAADLEQARAQVKSMEVQIGHLTINAPFDAIVLDRMVELGDFVKRGDPVAHLIDLDPILVTAMVSETDYLQIEVGQQAEGVLIDGRSLSGIVRFVAPSADEATRTFKVELEVPNADLSIPEGVTAQLSISGEPVMAHRLSAALFTLDDRGQIGVKTVDSGNVVRFNSVKIVGASNDEVFVTGLSAEADIITVGQEFVAVGDPVRTTRTDEAEDRGPTS